MTRVRRAGSQVFDSLRVRNYRLYFAGQLVSMSGAWVQYVAQDWLVLQLTGSGVAVGLVTGLQFLPMLLFGLWGGVVADRFDKRKVVIGTQAAAALLAVALGTLSWLGVVEVWMVYVLAFLLGCVTVVELPTRQAFVTEMVGPDRLANAIGLNSAVFNGARVVGPALAAATIPLLGVTPAFFVNALSFVAVIGALVAMDPTQLDRTPPVPRERGQVRAGLRYVWADPELRSTIGLVAVVATFGLNFKVVLPLLTSFTFGQGAGTYGTLLAVMSIGALAGALVAAGRARPSPALLTGTAAGFGVATVLVAVAPSPFWAGVALLPSGAAGIAFVATANATLQLQSVPAMRGRVMALYAIVFLGSTPFGGPLMGWISEAAGPRFALAAGGVASLVGAVVTAAARWAKAPVPGSASTAGIEGSASTVAA